MVGMSSANAGGVGLILGQGAKMPHASVPKNQNIKQKQCCNKFHIRLKSSPYHKKKKMTRKGRSSDVAYVLADLLRAFKKLKNGISPQLLFVVEWSHLNMTSL